MDTDDIGLIGMRRDALIGQTSGKITMYEGDAPYVFISYSHRDQSAMLEICNVLLENGVRYWYDNGLHSGDDWNYVIATQLEKASLCLLLLSQAAAASQYVKNEISFALNHRIPIHTVRIEEFDLPLDVEMMLGRIQMIDKISGYEVQMLESLPGEVFHSENTRQESDQNSLTHPLFTIDKELSNRQGTITYLGTHKRLGNKIMIQEDCYANVNTDEMKAQIHTVSTISHVLFPRVYDIILNDKRVYTFQEYRGEVFLDQYLTGNEMEELQIIEGITTVVDAMEYLFSKNLGFRDFARGSVFISNDKKLEISRLQHLHYGVIKLQQETRQYYFEKEVEEIAVLLYQLCTGSVPVLPFRMITSERLDKRFIDKVNLVLQKSTKENHRIQYTTFREILTDLNRRQISFGDRNFLSKRRKKLQEYESIKKVNMEHIFTSDEITDYQNENLEEKFGFDRTVLIWPTYDEAPVIKLRICSTGEVLEFAKDEIIIGRSQECDMVLNQPSVSRLHVKICKNSEGVYTAEDLESANGTFINGIRLLPGGEIMVGDRIQIGRIEVQLCEV